MARQKTVFLVVTVLILAVSCLSGPETLPEQTETQVTTSQQVLIQPPAQTQQTPQVIAVSQAQYNSTMEEIQTFIENLNQIIRTRNYNSWKDALSQEYFNEISSPENLHEISEQPALKTRGIILRTPEDYFNNVVVPSRANSRVDDIEFVGNNRVKAYTVNTTRSGEEQRLRLYDLEKIGNTWKIIN